jgi:hypothetical protein
MDRCACHPVPAVALCALLASGCYLSHPRGRPTPTPDAGPPDTPDATFFSPPRIIDGAVGPSCPSKVADFVCTDTGTGFVPVGTPYELPIYVGDGETCFCGEAIQCTAALTAPGLIDLTTGQCVPTLLCSGCWSYLETRCALPPLAQGDYHVRINGRDALDLHASNARPAEGPVDACHTTAAEPDACGIVWAPRPEHIDEVCHDANASPGQPIAVAIQDFCFDCGDLWASCTVTRTASSIHIVPRATSSGCDIECDECVLAQTRCFIPPLESGEYDVTVEGMEGSTLLLVSEEVVRPGRACNSIAED